MLMLCGCASGTGGTARDAGADWVLSVDPATPAGDVSPALLGHYDLSGALYDYPSHTQAVEGLRAMGLTEWRVGVGRWEISTRLLPTRTDGTSCAQWLTNLPPEARAPADAGDLTLLEDRDWFVGDAGVTLPDTENDARYSLAYVRSVLDVAQRLGATPFVDLDLMPRALSRGRSFSRVGTVVGLADPCLGTFSNGVSNAPPADSTVFAAAARGLVQRVVEGSGGEPPRSAPYWEVWNEYELGYAWTGSNDDYFDMALKVLVEWRRYREASPLSNVRGLRFGLGSFARAETAASVVQTLDMVPLPGPMWAPLDFVSFHAYDNDPLVILAQLKLVADARAHSTHYKDLELVLSEWGPQLEHPPAASSMDPSLLVATVLARAPTLGVTRAHHSLLFDFLPGVDFPWVPLGADGHKKPLAFAYELLHALVGTGGTRLAVATATDGALNQGLGAVLVVKPASGGVRALLVNRDTVSHRAELRLAGRSVTARRVRVFDEPSAPPRDVTPEELVVVPPRALVLLEE